MQYVLNINLPEYPNLRLRHVQFEKIQIQRENPKGSLIQIRGLPETQLVNLHNSRLQMYHNPGTHPCNEAIGGKSKNDKCKTCDYISTQKCKDYLEKIQMQHLTVTSCKSKGKYVYHHKEFPFVYNGSTDTIMSQRNKARRGLEKVIERLGPLENYWCYVIGSTGNINLDRYLEDALILLQLQQNNYHSLNHTLNLLDLIGANTELFAYLKEDISENQKLKLLHLYTLKIFFDFLFRYTKNITEWNFI